MKRVIPTVLVRGSVAYKGPGFGEQCTRSVGSALSICRTHAKRGVDELIILDIAATDERRGPDLGMIERLSEGCFIPITVGGGVRTIDDINRLLRAGADKVAICTAARERPEFIEQAIDRFGAQAIVMVIEHETIHEGDSARYDISMQAGEIVLQSRDRDGTMQGYDLGFLSEIASSLYRPVIVSGGCSGPEDMLEAFKAGADGCAAGALFQFTDCTPRDCSEYAQSQGLTVRL
jgi:cyclase